MFISKLFLLDLSAVHISVADPGLFSIFFAETYRKMKEMDFGRVRAHHAPLDPPLHLLNKTEQF